LYYTASGIITFSRWPSGAQVHGMSIKCSKNVEEYNKLIIKREFVH